MAFEILTPSYETGWVAASFLLSALGAYTALSASSQVRQSGGRVSWLNAGLAGLALGGVGIWSMHFLGMLAWNPGLTVGYQWVSTLLSLVVAVATSAGALGYMAAGRFSYARLLVAGPLAGAGVSAMHFMGMGAMQFGGYLQWQWGTVALAIGIAVVAATAALWLAFHVHRSTHRLAAAGVMAGAVCAMHYTGMAAAQVVCTSSDRYERLAGLLYSDQLRLLVLAVAVCASVLIAMDALMQRLARQAAAGSRISA